MAPKALERAVKGAMIEGLGRRGKYLLLALEGERTLVMHLRLTGNLVLVEGESKRDPSEGRRLYEAERSMHNTPNTFGIWVIGEVCNWILAEGGLDAMAERNARKAKLLYDALDGSRAWKPHAKPGSRSNMNITWRGTTPELEDKLIAEAEARGLSGLRGHRSVGGMRASLYNAFPEEGVKRLVELLHQFES